MTYSCVKNVRPRLTTSHEGRWQQKASLVAEDTVLKEREPANVRNGVGDVPKTGQVDGNTDHALQGWQQIGSLQKLSISHEMMMRKALRR